MATELIVILLIVVAMTALAVTWVRAILKSHAMVRRYREADQTDRRQLEDRMEWDSELEAYTRPLAIWEITVAGIIVFGMIYVVAM